MIRSNFIFSSAMFEMKWIFAFLLLGAVLAISFGQQESQPYVQIGSEILRGTISVKGGPFYAFKGIPYAKPPVGKHTFKFKK